jgi:dienelactone hydrolase
MMTQIRKKISSQLYFEYSIWDMYAVQFEDEVSIPCDGKRFQGFLQIPAHARGIILFSHGSGSSRHSPRNKVVADYLFQRKFGTLLFDLLTEQEDTYYANRFDLPLMTRRLVEASKWIQNTPVTPDCKIGYFGASTGAASALNAAHEMKIVRAIVSRGGRPDLATEALRTTHTPTLLIVGSLDPEVIKLNQEAIQMIPGKKKLEIVQGATHLFEEPGTMDMVCDLAYNWFDFFF